ncbi:MAG: DUF4340 domain-containing protein [Candidatus Eisenbacteria bacterium]|uniref:DUF4340 domain-containing protein n=1 Tax=Eiseniibacteriota bacterium TaxID=2212470 RepID=A0A937X854_UNCEI|nr:DUF4340 domain-containing protein [Candidatus Eisenbacteria bacterium]
MPTMRPRTMIILAAMAAVLLLLAWTTRRAERERETIPSGAIFPGLVRAAVAEIRLSDEGATVVLREEEGQWRVASEGRYPADTLAVSRILDKLPLLDRRHLRSTSPAMQERFEVGDAQGIELAFADSRGGELGRMRVGKSGPDFRSQYVRPAGSNEVFLIPENLRSVVDPRRAQWRDRTIFAFRSDEVARLVFHPEGEEPLVAERDAGGLFKLVAPEEGPVKAQAIDASLRALSNLRCDAFADTSVTLESAGLLPPRQRVEIQLQDGASFGLDIGIEAPEERRVFVKRDRAETIFLLGAGRIATLVRGAEDLRETEPAPEPPAGPADT